MVALCLVAVSLAQGPVVPKTGVQDWELRRVAVRGNEDDPQVSFLSIQAIAVDRRGRAYVGEAGEGRISVFDSAGELLRKIGRLGEGPGEFKDVHALTFVGDTLLVADWGLARLTGIDPAGDVVRIGKLTLAAGTRFRLGAMLEAGSMAALAVMTVPTPKEGVPGYPLLRVDSAGSVKDTLAWLRFEQRQMPRVRVGDTNLGFPQPFAAQALVASASNRRGVVVVDAPIAAARKPSTFRVQRLDGTGNTVYDRAYPFVPQPINDIAMAEAVQNVTSRLRRLAIPAVQAPDLAEHVERGIWKPEFLPPVTAVTYTDGGQVWLRREVNSTRIARWDVLGPDGTLVARVRGPAETKRLFEGNGVFWGIEVDSMGIEQVVRYEIVR